MYMDSETNTPQQPPRLLFWVVSILLVLILAAAFWLPAHQTRALKPAVPTNTAVPVDYDGEAIPVAFPDLQANPAAYLEQRIRVSGLYARLAPPDCAAYSGPIIRWGVVADELQMNAIGMETVRHLIPVDTMLTVEGVWRRYVGPVGCGKEPPEDVIWYLAVERIVQPNPLPLPGLPGGITGSGGGVVPTMTATAVPGILDETTVTPAASPPTVVGTTTPTATINTIPVVTVTPELSPTVAIATMTPPIIGGTLTATSDGGNVPTATATATPTPNRTTTPGPNPTSTPNNGQPPSVPTATPGDVEPPYPEPPTLTPDGSYP